MDLANIVPENREDISHLLNINLRDVDNSKLYKLSTILDQGNHWRRLLDELTGHEPTGIDGNISKLKLSLENINLIEQQLYCGKSPSLALLNHWSITGRRRPTIKTLIFYLQRCHLKWAEEYVYETILGLRRVQPHLVETTHMPITYSASGPRLRKIDSQFEFPSLDEFVEKLTYKCPRYEFLDIYTSSNGFCDKPFDPNQMTGTKLGEGRFSGVFKCQARKCNTHDDDAIETIAAKLLKSECNMMNLDNEINLMSRLEHPNLLKLLGISIGSQLDTKSDSGVDIKNTNQYLCLVYPLIVNGSLLDCLSSGLATEDWRYLGWAERVDIAVKIARGIDHLHSSSPVPMLHRDIKPANIFIDQHIQPKVGDFSLICELKNANHLQPDIMQSSIIGTSIYMAPETFQGDISTKSDAFSYGIVLLELLSGLKPCDENLDEDLISYVNEKLSEIEDEEASDELTRNQSIDTFLRGLIDVKAGEWNFQVARKLFNISMQLTEARKSNRKDISQVLPELESLKLN